MSYAFNLLCDQASKMADKWRPFIEGKKFIKAKLTVAETGESMGTHILTKEECQVIAHAEIEPVLLRAMDLKDKS